MAANTDPPFRYLCKDLRTGVTGELIADDDGIRLKLVRFDHQIFLGGAENFTVELESGDIATLLDCVPMSWGHAVLHTRPNQVLIGRRPWSEDDRVKLLTFSFWNARQALHYNDHMMFAETQDGEHPFNQLVPRIDFSKLRILEAKTDFAVVRVGLDASLHFDRFRSGPDFRPLVSIEFSHPQDVTDAHRFASNILTFFELSSGCKSRLLNMMVSTFSAAEREADPEDFPPNDFKLRLPFTAWEDDGIGLIPCALFSVFETEQRELTRAALEQWVARLSEWQPAYALLSRYIASRAQFDRDRLLRLAALFESIPLNDSRTDVTGSERAAIVAAAQKGAVDVGRSDLSDRIRELLGGLNKKTLKVRLNKALERVARRFGTMPADMHDDLGHFAKLRNDAAHGRIALSGEDAAKDIGAMRAAELLCLLCMLNGLEVPESARDSIGRHSLGSYLIFRQ